MVKFSLPKLTKQNNQEEEKQETAFQQRRKILLQSSFRLVLIAMGAVAIIYGLFTFISGSALFVPQSANGVLDSVNQGSAYTWNSQTVRLVNLAGQVQQQDAARGATIDLERNKFQAQIVGVLPQRTLFVSDGQFTIRLTEEQQLRGGGWELATDYCNGADTVPATSLQMPTADELKAANPQIEDENATIFGQQAWALSFEATPDIVKRLLWLPFFEQSLNAFPDERPWVISDFEKEQINEGNFQTIDGQIWVNRDGQRRIQQIDLRIAIEQGSRYRFLAQIVPLEDDNDALADTNLNKPPCQ